MVPVFRRERSEMKNYMNDMLAVFTAVPLACTMMAVFTGSLMPAAAAGFLIFALTAFLPFCRGRENLWILLMTAPASIPLNFMVLLKYPAWADLLPEMGSGGMGYLLYMPGLMLIMSGAELLFAGMAGRILWPGQIRLYIPEPSETEDEEAGE